MAYRCHRPECISVISSRSVANMASGGQHWNEFKDNMEEVCQGRKRKKDSDKSAKDLETIVVQRPSAEVAGAR